MLDRPARPDPLTEPPVGLRAVDRLALVDKLRGLVIVIMVLDHVRDFYSRDALFFSATDLDKTNALLFATRWVTHLCAPTFVLLAGISVYLQHHRGKRGWALSRFLLARGLWLILLEVTWVSFAFGFAEPFVLLQVIWAIGMSFILLAGAVWLPPRAVLALGLAIVLGHDLLTPIPAQTFGVFGVVWTLMVKPGLIPAAHAYVSYPALPWFGIMAVGYGAGALVLRPPARSDRWLCAIGLALLAVFAGLRGLNFYGDPVRWAPKADAMHTALAVLNVAKYPPSLDYTLVTLGIVLALSPLIGRLGGPFGRMITTFGRVPLFTYLIHLYVAHGSALLIGLAMGIPPHLFSGSFGNRSGLIAAGWGFGLGGVYLAWIAIILALYPLSAWFARVKARRRDWWLSYI